jgi:hypothetical protein
VECTILLLQTVTYLSYIFSQPKIYASMPKSFSALGFGPALLFPGPSFSRRVGDSGGAFIPNRCQAGIDVTESLVGDIARLGLDMTSSSIKGSLSKKSNLVISDPSA